MLDKILFSHAGVIRTNEGKAVLASLGVITSETLEELRISMKNEIDRFIDHLNIQNEGHEVTKGIVIHPLIHVIHNDQNINNIEEINNLYAKDLN